MSMNYLYVYLLSIYLYYKVTLTNAYINISDMCGLIVLFLETITWREDYMSHYIYDSSKSECVNVKGKEKNTIKVMHLCVMNEQQSR